MIAVNYAARAYGVKRGDSVPVVKAKCPSVKLVHVETLTCNSQGKACDGSPRQVRGIFAHSEGTSCFLLSSSVRPKWIRDRALIN